MSNLEKYPFEFDEANTKIEITPDQQSEVFELPDKDVFIKVLADPAIQVSAENQSLDAETVNTPQKRIKYVKSELDKLNESKSGISEIMPKSMFFTYEGKEGPRCAIATQKIHGEDLSASVLMREKPGTLNEMVTQLGKAVELSLSVFDESVEADTRDLYIPDIVRVYQPADGGGATFRNFMWGKTQEEKKERLYLADTFPLWHFNHPISALQMLNSLKDALEDFEKQGLEEYIVLEGPTPEQGQALVDSEEFRNSKEYQAILNDPKYDKEHIKDYDWLTAEVADYVVRKEIETNPRYAKWLEVKKKTLEAIERRRKVMSEKLNEIMENKEA